MRITRIEIAEWRHFRDLTMVLPRQTPLVCVVGSNGTGKSQLLELVAACAHHFGLSAGIEIPRGNPFNDVHDFTVELHAADGVGDQIDQHLTDHAAFDEWDRTLLLTSSKADETGSADTRITAGGVSDAAAARNLAKTIVRALGNADDVHFLFLDADRAYPKDVLVEHELVRAYERDWSEPNLIRDHSYRPTATLYDEWIKYFLAQEHQVGARLQRKMRRAKQSGQELPEYDDYADPYAEALNSVLPHVRFLGARTEERTLLFDSAGFELTFNQLSGGEREIAFLIGQIDRFGLRHGLFLLDEPELHLNSDLIRDWVAYLSGIVEEGQIWLATHSLEAVEAAGTDATFVLERDDETRIVSSAARLDGRPVLSTLSRVLGTPAFSVGQLAFVFIEGDENIGERERFRRLASDHPELRFIESGSCNDVARRCAEIKDLAEETDDDIRVGGIVDRDFRGKTDEFDEIGIYMLQVHEVENFFLHPPTVELLLQRNGTTGGSAMDLIRSASDARAGSWVFQWMMANSSNTPFSPDDQVAVVKNALKGLSLDELEAPDSELKRLVRPTGSAFEGLTKEVQPRLEIAVKAYRKARQREDFWTRCEGKQILSSVARQVGFNSPQTHERAALVAWEKGDVNIPDELTELRKYLDDL